LEHKGCQVFWSTAKGLARASQEYFELIVLKLDPSTETAPAMYQKIKGYPELAPIPMVILIPRETLDKSIAELKQEPVYFLPMDGHTAPTLLSIIDEVHYLSHRYPI
jgi:hypothetical protein